LSDFDSAWGSATVDGDEQSNFDPPPDGDHVIELRKASALTSKKGDDWVVLELRELRSGHDWTVMLGFKNQGQANLTKTACSRLGVQVDEVFSLEQLSQELERHTGGYFEVAVKTNGEYRNTYVNGPARQADAMAAAGSVSDVPVPQQELAPVKAAAVVDGPAPWDDDEPAF
jgi:hypothetical protein